MTKLLLLRSPYLCVFALSILSVSTVSGFVVLHKKQPAGVCCSLVRLRSSKQQQQLQADVSAQEALARTAAHLQRLERQQRQQQQQHQVNENDPFAQERQDLYQHYIQQSANALKDQLEHHGLTTTGRKPALATRLVDYDLQGKHGFGARTEESDASDQVPEWNEVDGATTTAAAGVVTHFAGLTLSDTAGQALGSAHFARPTGIQAQAIPALVNGESIIMHAETGSGKTLAYLLPFTELMWQAHDQGLLDDDNAIGYGLVLTPTRELAAQVAGIATVLSPPGSVRLISHATNLMSDGSANKERGEETYGGRLEEEQSSFRSASPKLIIGSAKSIMHSLYGDGVMPASPTTKPEAQYFLKHVRYVMLDEVDRLLNVKKSRRNSSSRRNNRHEKPAAIVTAAVMRMTLGRAQVVAASATVGRPLKRELARVLGLPAQSCPRVVRDDENNNEKKSYSTKVTSSTRAVTVPSTVRNYVFAVEGSPPSTGKLLTSAAFVLRQLSNKPRKVLLVLTRACGMSTQHTLGALKHFGFQPISLLDALDTNGGGTNDMIQLHRLVSGASGVGESIQENNDESGYLLVTGEDSVRGLHLDGLDVVLVVEQPHGPDEYTHIAGRTGRSGQSGSVINVVSTENAAALVSWEHMLSLSFETVEGDDIAKL